MMMKNTRPHVHNQQACTWDDAVEAAPLEVQRLAQGANTPEEHVCVYIHIYMCACARFSDE